MRPIPKLVYVPAPCGLCGARTEAEAETRCQISQDMSGEYDCKNATEFSEGVAVAPTAESLRLLDDWYREAGLAEEAMQG